MLQPHEQASATEIALIALGSNLTSSFGSPENTLRQGLEKMADAGLSIHQVSRFFQTPCFPAGAGPDYVNACASVQWAGSARDLLALLHGVETLFGRDRAQRWASRTLDIDLLALGAQVHPDLDTQEAWQALSVENQQLRAPEELILPHPRLQDRAFVLVPLADIAADWTHPVLGVTVSQMLAQLLRADRAAVVPMGDGQ
ncbi:MAG: 2-amino-4-hydroxy-6-hydroxymethyldihydropteridine diphosphokinase [Pseudomonadota bacterium]